MAVEGRALEVLPGFGDPPGRAAQRGAEALLTAIDSLAQATNLQELVERAAAELLPLSSASAALLYLEAPDTEPLVSAAGGEDRAPGGVRTVLLRHAAATQTAVPYTAVDKGSLLASFVSRNRRRTS